jgi:hypothetical protein
VVRPIRDLAGQWLEKWKADKDEADLANTQSVAANPHLVSFADGATLAIAGHVDIRGITSKRRTGFLGYTVAA